MGNADFVLKKLEEISIITVFITKSNNLISVDFIFSNNAISDIKKVSSIIMVLSAFDRGKSNVLS